MSTATTWLKNRCAETVKEEQEINRKQNMFLKYAKIAQRRWINDIIEDVFYYTGEEINDVES